MAGLYPDEQIISLFGETISFPGLDAEGKFTNGDFSNPFVKPSFIPAETVNLILDNIASLISKLGGTPNNMSPTQLADVFLTLQDLRTGKALPPGTVLYSAMNAARLAQCRLMPLEGQVIDATTYADLVAAVYCGDSLNASAPSFYKTSNASGTTRSSTGDYFVLPDLRGMFIQGTGSQTRSVSVVGNTTYNGGQIGAWQEDRIRNIEGNSSYSLGSIQSGAFSSGEAFGDKVAIGNPFGFTKSNFNASRVVPTGAYNAPARISLQVVITY